MQVSKPEIVRLLRDHYEEVAHFLKVRAPIKSHVFQATLTIRAAEIYQAAVVLLKLGHTTGGSILLRALVETVFLIKVSADESSTPFLQWRSQSLLDESKHLEFLLRAASPDCADSQRRRLRELKTIIRARKVKRITVQDLARVAGMESEYETAFQYLSWSTHGTALNQLQYFAMEAGTPVDLQSEPDEGSWGLLAGLLSEWWGRAFAIVAATRGFSVPMSFRRRDAEIAVQLKEQ